MRVIVPFGRRKLVGVVVELPDTPALSADLIKDVDQVLDDLPALPADWLRLTAFAAGYYQRPLGEVMLPALPAGFRKVSAYQGKRRSEEHTSALQYLMRISYAVFCLKKTNTVTCHQHT